MKFKEIAARLTGISCPVFGINWNPPEPEVAAARRVITFLEDRRVLFDPCEQEVPHHCAESVVRIREFLTGELSRLDGTTEFADSLRAMRAACRKFLTRVQNGDREIIRDASHQGSYASWVFHDALGQLRGVFGVHIGQLAVRHGIDVEDDLAQILPAADEEGSHKPKGRKASARSNDPG
jgi:hypothetical protein